MVLAGLAWHNYFSGRLLGLTLQSRSLAKIGQAWQSSADLKKERSSFRPDKSAESKSQSSRVHEIWLFNISRLHDCWRSIFRLVDGEMCHYHLKWRIFSNRFVLFFFPLPFLLCHLWLRVCLHYIFLSFHKNVPFSVSQRVPFGCVRAALFTGTGLWLAAEKLSRFDTYQVSSEMPFFKRQKAGEAFASDSRVP